MAQSKHYFLLQEIPDSIPSSTAGFFFNGELCHGVYGLVVHVLCLCSVLCCLGRRLHLWRVLSADHSNFLHYRVLTHRSQVAVEGKPKKIERAQFFTSSIISLIIMHAHTKSRKTIVCIIASITNIRLIKLLY
jgi:hypothetical protein